MQIYIRAEDVLTNNLERIILFSIR